MRLKIVLRDEQEVQFKFHIGRCHYKTGLLGALLFLSHVLNRKGDYGILMELKKGDIAATPLLVVTTHTKSLDINLLKLANVLAK